jgi:hypothetical protein
MSGMTRGHSFGGDIAVARFSATVPEEVPARSSG